MDTPDLAPLLSNNGWHSFAYGEGFVREKPEVHSHLPVSELMIRQTETGDSQNVRKMYGLDNASDD